MAELPEKRPLLQNGHENAPVQFQESWGAGLSEPLVPSEPIDRLLLCRQATSKAPAIWIEGEGSPASYADLLGAARAAAAELLTLSWPSIEEGEHRIMPMLLRTKDGFETVAGALSCLMAGVAYTALDVIAQPGERLEYMVKVLAAPGALISEGAEVELKHRAYALLSEIQTLIIVRPDSIPASSNGLPLTSLAHAMGLYWTSGSTGRPKGVVVPCGAAMTHYVDYLPKFGIGLGDRVLRTTAISFDVTFSIVFGALLHGATICWPISEVLKDPEALSRVCEQFSVKFLCMVPTCLSMFLEQHRFPVCTRHLGCAGEALHWPLVDRLLETHGSDAPEFHNRYGPTECSNISTVNCNVGAAAVRESATVPVGTPCAHRELHLVDWPEGALGEGELWITGLGLAFGYFKQPDVTNKAFMALPTNAKGPAGKAGCRAYKTGDVMRWSARGELIFCGRVDHQLKLRGNRVELAEIEGVFKECPGAGVTECVVVAEGVGEAVRLVAFASPKSANVHLLTQTATAKLPSYMVPAVIMTIDEWPRGSTGKTDRNALVKIAADTAPQTQLGGVMELDSLGQIRQRRAKLDEREVTITSNLRSFFIVGLLYSHMWPRPQFYEVCHDGLYVEGLTSRDFWVLDQSTCFQGDCRPELRFVSFLSSFTWFDRTTRLVLVAGYQDSLDLKPLLWNMRDSVVLVLFVIDKLIIQNIQLWWLGPFFLCRLLSQLGAYMGRYRFLIYAGYYFGVIFYIVAGCPSRTPLTFPLIYWFAVEIGPMLRQQLKKWNFGEHVSYRWLWCSLIVIVWSLNTWLTLFEEENPRNPEYAKIGQQFCGASSFGVVAWNVVEHVFETIRNAAFPAAFAMLVSKTGWHLPSTWSIGTLLIMLPTYSSGWILAQMEIDFVVSAKPLYNRFCEHGQTLVGGILNEAARYVNDLAYSVQTDGGWAAAGWMVMCSYGICVLTYLCEGFISQQIVGFILLTRRQLGQLCQRR
eukprot:TRINITY_DN55075_c0_g1_i1.p1 TRINITY_DN55075_c0_g1~~TRINITY_DN55075_c0_g1_i1.p1  ORF type:complete len:980 (+),score=107.60 TRINITY_DN55075_c0_g1_i1:82-3021(+)